MEIPLHRGLLAAFGRPQERPLSRSVYHALVCPTAAEKLPSLGDGEPASQGDHDAASLALGWSR